MNIDTKIFEDILLEGVRQADIEHSVNHRNRKQKIFGDSVLSTVSPSSASILMRDSHGFRNLIGSCGREVWFRVTGILPSNPTDIISRYKMSMGKDIESTEQNYLEKGLAAFEGINKENSGFFKNVLFYCEDVYEGVNILGEMDGILILDGRPFPLEIKSIYGYYALRNVFGNKSIVGKPKDNQFLQAAIYVYALQHLDKLRIWSKDGDEAVEITNLITEPCTHGFMRYVDRSDARTKTFMISMQPITNAQEENYIPLVDGEEYLNITMKDIFKRYKMTSDYIEAYKRWLGDPSALDYKVPPRDAIYQYDAARLAWLRGQTDTALLNKDERAEYDKNGTVTKGDWQCRYCSFKDYCLGTTPWMENYPSDEEIKILVQARLEANNE